MAETVPQPHHLVHLFNDIGAKYEEAFRENAAQIDSIEWLLSELAPKLPAKTLDIGSGTGRPVVASLSKAGHDALGIDVSPTMISAAKERVPNARFELIDSRKFEAGEGEFDAITAYFSYIAGVTQDEIRGGIKRIHRWLKPGGLFVWATVPLDGENMEIKWLGRPVTVSSIDAAECVRCIESAGFEIVQKKEITFLPKAVECGLCTAEEVWEEPQIFIYAKKK